MAEIKLNKRYKYAGDIVKALLNRLQWTLEDVTEFMNSIEDADVVEVKHGEWIEDETHISKRRKKYVCSYCLHYIIIKTTTDINSRRYCYECGARMVEDIQ